MTRRLTPWLLAAAAAGCIPSAHAVGRLVDVDVVDRDSGATLTVYTQRGTRYIAGRPGVRYAIRVANRTGSRVLAVMAVDGVNILTGDPCDRVLTRGALALRDCDPTHRLAPARAARSRHAAP